MLANNRAGAQRMYISDFTAASLCHFESVVWDAEERQRPEDRQRLATAEDCLERPIRRVWKSLAWGYPGDGISWASTNGIRDRNELSRWAAALGSGDLPAG